MRIFLPKLSPSLLAISAALLVTAQIGAGASAPSQIPQALLSPFTPLPSSFQADARPALVELGRMLYYDPRLSRDRTISCNSCHALDQYGVDHQPVSTGVGGQHGDRNSPTVYNAAPQVAQFWDGRARDLEDQATAPILNPIEMAMPSDHFVVDALRAIPAYVEAFQRAFPGSPDPVTFPNVAKAIGAFERGLVTPSRWDDFLRGDSSALTDAEKAGFLKFVTLGCSKCHEGTLIGGTSFRKLGVYKKFPDSRDIGRFKITHNADDKMFFKVPTLRNIAMTAPYLHNGTIPTLEQTVVTMGKYQLDKKLKDEDVALIIAWLKALTGNIPADYIRQPALP